MNAPFPARPLNLIDAALRTAIVGLTLATASIHATLGGALFTLNAIGYVVLATAMVAPLVIASRSAGSCASRWLGTPRPRSSDGPSRGRSTRPPTSPKPSR